MMLFVCLLLSLFLSFLPSVSILVPSAILMCPADKSRQHKVFFLSLSEFQVGREPLPFIQGAREKNTKKQQQENEGGKRKGNDYGTVRSRIEREREREGRKKHVVIALEVVCLCLGL